MRANYPVIFSDEQALASFCDDEERNEMAQRELKYFEKQKTFLFLHPIAIEYADTLEFEHKRRENPGDFMREMMNAEKNVSRYKRLLDTNPKADDETRMKWLKLKSDWESKVRLMQNMLSK